MIWGSATPNRDDDRRDGDDEFEAAPGGESFEPSEDAEAEPTEEIRAGETLALFGLTDSGKTSFLYALKHAPARPARLRWSWPAASPPFAAATRSGGDALEGTRPGTFFVRPLGTLRRAWRRGPEGPRGFLACPSRRVSLPEVAGENVQMFVGGLEAADARSQRVNERIRDLLSTTSEVLFLVGVKESTASGMLTQDSVERSLSAAASALDRCAGFMRDPAVRPKGRPVFLTFVITKRDALRRTGLAVVRARAGESLLAGILATRGGELASLLRRTEGGDVEFDVNDVCDHRDADVAVQEAAAWDFVRCHAPKAAVTLDALSRRHGVSLRVVTCKPFGCECRTPDGLSSALPLPGQIDSAMVWESLDDLVERSFRWRTRVRIQAASLVLAAAALALTALPLMHWMAGSRADALIAASRFDSAIDTLDAWYVRLNPWRLFAHAVSDRHRFAEAQRWDRLRTSMQGASIEDRRLAEVEQKVAALDPSGTLVGDRIRKRDVAMLAEFVMQESESPKAALADRLSARDGLLVRRSDITDLCSTIRKVYSPDGADPARWEEGEWRDRADRVESLVGWIGAAPGPGKPSIVVEASGGKSGGEPEEELLSLRELALFRAEVASEKVPGPGRQLDKAWLAAVADKIDRASKKIRDAPSKTRLEALRQQAVAAWWNDEVPVDPAAIAERLASAAGWGDDEARAACDPLARTSMRDWLQAQGRKVAGSKAPSQFKTQLEGIEASLRQRNESLGSAAIQNLDQLRDQCKPLVVMAQAAEKLAAEGVIPDDAKVLERREDCRLTFTIGRDPEEVVEVDLEIVAERLRDDARTQLSKRIPALCADAARGAEPGRVAKVEGVAKALDLEMTKEQSALMALSKLVAGLKSDPPDGDEGLGKAICDAIGAARAEDVRPILDELASKLGKARRLTVLGKVVGCEPPAAPQAAGGRTDMILELARSVLRDDSLGPEDVKSLTETLTRARPSVSASDLRVQEARRHLSLACDAVASEDDSKKAAKRASLLVGGSPGLALDACAELAKRVLEALESANPAAADAAVKALRRFETELDGEEDARAIKEALDELDGHLKRMSTWGLKPVQPRDDRGNRVDGRITFLLAEYELDIEDLRKLPVEEQDKLIKDVPSAFERVDGGRFVRRKHEDRPPFCDAKGRGSELQLSRDEATALARCLGMRLPTKKEWKSADLGVTQDKGKSVLKELRTRAGEKTPERADFGRDTLRAVGDESSDGVVGLVLGVREWASDDTLPQGGCTMDPNPAKKLPPKLADVGLRPAMDAVPPGIRGIASRLPPLDPGPGPGPPQ